MNTLSHIAVLTVFLSALVGCQQTLPPAQPTPETPPTTQTPLPPSELSTVTGTLPGWGSGQAFATMAGGLNVTFEMGEEAGYRDVMLFPPLFQGEIAPDGTFRVELSEPNPSTLFPLGCSPEDPDVTGVGFVVASSVPTPTRGPEVLGVYVLVDSDRLQQQVIWLYAAQAYEAQKSCTAPDEQGLNRIDITLQKGWNQVIVRMEDTGVVLTSQKAPDSFVWLDPFLAE